MHYKDQRILNQHYLRFICWIWIIFNYFKVSLASLYAQFMVQERLLKLFPSWGQAVLWVELNRCSGPMRIALHFPLAVIRLHNREHYLPEVYRSKQKPAFTLQVSMTNSDSVTISDLLTFLLKWPVSDECILHRTWWNKPKIAYMTSHINSISTLSLIYWHGIHIETF